MARPKIYRRARKLTISIERDTKGKATRLALANRESISSAVGKLIDQAPEPQTGIAPGSTMKAGA